MPGTSPLPMAGSSLTTAITLPNYPPHYVHLNSLLTKHWHLISDDPFLSTLFPSPPQVCYRRNPTISNTLVKAALPGHPPPPGETTPINIKTIKSRTQTLTAKPLRLMFEKCYSIFISYFCTICLSFSLLALLHQPEHFSVQLQESVHHLSASMESFLCHSSSFLWLLVSRDNIDGLLSAQGGGNSRTGPQM